MCSHGDPRCFGTGRSVLEHICSSCLDDVARSEGSERSELTCLCLTCNPLGVLPPMVHDIPPRSSDEEDEPFPFRMDE